MAQPDNAFRGGNVVHRIELPRLRRPARRDRGRSIRPSGEPLQPAFPADPSGPSRPTAATRRGAPEPAPSGPLDEGARTAVDVEFEVLDGSQVPNAQFARAQERQARLEFALAREVGAQDDLKAAHRGEVEILERRLTKLRVLLEAQEVDLLRAVAEGQIDSGWASCYRSVQGLDMSAPDADLKREMLTQIFEANRELQARIASLGA